MDGRGWVHYETANHVATITLNRPEVLNAFVPEQMMDVIAHLEQAEADPDVRVVVLTGAGRGFCAGGDVRELVRLTSGPGPGPNPQLGEKVTRASRLLHEIPKPTIAAVNGACAGAGLCLALAADLRYAASSAVFTSAFVRVGVSGDFGGIWLATKILGTARARRLFLLSERLSATEAERLGLVSNVFADDEFTAGVSAVAAELASFPPVTLAGVKANLNCAETADLDTYFEEETATFRRVRTSKDFGEATRAFLEKRPPSFTGE